MNTIRNGITFLNSFSNLSAGVYSSFVSLWFMARLCRVVFCKLSICKGFLKLPTVARVESCRFVKRMKEKHCFGLSIDFWRQWTLITVIRVLSYRRECRIAMLVLTEGKGKLQILLISITFSNHLICKRACKICCKLTLSQISVLLLASRLQCCFGCHAF